MEQHLTWTSPAPFWKESITFSNAAVRREFSRPAILRFATDDFMTEFASVAASDPTRLRLYEALPETWRSPAGPPAQAAVLPQAATPALAPARRRVLLQRQRALDATTPERSSPPQSLKLYQPAHGRFYMVTSCLVCRVPGLPDHALATGGSEKAAFVVRRLVNTNADPKVAPDPDTATEYAFDGKQWQTVANVSQLQPGEEQIPLSPFSYDAADGRRRRLLLGLIPVARREAYYNSATPGATSRPNVDQKLLDPRYTLLHSQVISGWNSLYEIVTRLKTDTEKFNALPESDRDVDEYNKVVNEATGRLITGSYYIVLEMAKYLEAYAKTLVTALRAGAPRDTLASEAQRNLFDALTGYKYDGVTLSKRLLDALAAEGTLDSVTVAYNPTGSNPAWPQWTFPLLSVVEPDPKREIPAAIAPGTPSTATKLGDLIYKALDALPSAALPPPSAVAQAATNPQEIVWFTVRCVLDRRDCGPLAPSVVSAPTAPFQMASFFDPEAPARPIRIGLPIDPTPAGLRKVDRNTAFVMSDMMACHFKRLQGMTFADLVLSVLPWPFKKSLPGGGGNPCPAPEAGVGLVCSFSIPIITICALILLIIIVKLLDLIFNWIPYFVMCFPIPGFRSKESA